MQDIRKILLCIDGEEHTAKAEDYAITLARQSGAVIVALYAVSPYLKKFTTEIYAVNRDECCAHLDRSLMREGGAALAIFEGKASRHQVKVSSMVLYGFPEQIIAEEAEQGCYDLVILGGKTLRTWKERFESCNLPGKIFKDLSAPVLFVR